MNALPRNAYLAVQKFDRATPAIRRPVLMITRRCLRPGRQGPFDQVLHGFLRFAVSFPGHIDVHVLSWIRGDVTRFAVVHRFNDAASRQKFTGSPDYRVWLIWLQQFTDAESTDDTADSNAPRPNTFPAWSLALVGAIFAFGLVGLVPLLPAVVYFKLPAWHAGIRQALSCGLLLVMAGWIGVMALPDPFARTAQKLLAVVSWQAK